MAAAPSDAKEKAHWEEVFTGSLTLSRISAAGPCELDGWAFKQGAQISSWRRRYFLLRFPFMYYFKDAVPDDKVQGCMFLRDAQLENSELKDKHILNITQAVHRRPGDSGTSFTLGFEATKDRDDWHRVIDTRLRKEKRKTPPAQTVEKPKRPVLACPADPVENSQWMEAFNGNIELASLQPQLVSQVRVITDADTPRRVVALQYPFIFYFPSADNSARAMGCWFLRSLKVGMADDSGSFSLYGRQAVPLRPGLESAPREWGLGFHDKATRDQWLEALLRKHTNSSSARSTTASETLLPSSDNSAASSPRSVNEQPHVPADWEAQLQKSQEEKSNLLADLAALQKQHSGCSAELSVAREDLARATALASRLQMEVTTLRRPKDDPPPQTEDSRLLAEGMNRALWCLEKLADQEELVLHTALNAAETKVSQIESEWKLAAAEKAVLTQEKDALLERIRELTEDKKRLSSNNTQFSDRNQQLEADKQALIEKLQEAAEEAKLAAQSRQETQSQNAELAKKILALADANSVLLSKQQDLAKQLQVQQEEKEISTQRDTQQKDDLEKRVSELTKELRIQTENYAGLMDRYRAATEALQSAANEVSSKDAQVRHLSQQISDITEKNSEALQKLRLHMENEVTMLRLSQDEERDVSLRRCEALESQLLLDSVKIKQLQEDNIVFRATVDALQRYLDGAFADISTLWTDLVEIQHEREFYLAAYSTTEHSRDALFHAHQHTVSEISCVERKLDRIRGAIQRSDESNVECISTLAIHRDGAERKVRELQAELQSTLGAMTARQQEQNNVEAVLVETRNKLSGAQDDLCQLHERSEHLVRQLLLSLESAEQVQRDLILQQRGGFSAVVFDWIQEVAQLIPLRRSLRDLQGESSALLRRLNVSLQALQEVVHGQDELLSSAQTNQAETQRNHDSLLRLHVELKAETHILTEEFHRAQLALAESRQITEILTVFSAQISVITNEELKRTKLEAQADLGFQISVTHLFARLHAESQCQVGELQKSSKGQESQLQIVTTALREAITLHAACATETELLSQTFETRLLQAEDIGQRWQYGWESLSGQLTAVAQAAHTEAFAAALQSRLLQEEAKTTSEAFETAKIEYAMALSQLQLRIEDHQKESAELAKKILMAEEAARTADTQKEMELAQARSELFREREGKVELEQELSAVQQSLHYSEEQLYEAQAEIRNLKESETSLRMLAEEQQRSKPSPRVMETRITQTESVETLPSGSDAAWKLAAIEEQQRLQQRRLDLLQEMVAQGGNKVHGTTGNADRQTQPSLAASAIVPQTLAERPRYGDAQPVTPHLTLPHAGLYLPVAVWPVRGTASDRALSPAHIPLGSPSQNPKPPFGVDPNSVHLLRRPPQRGQPPLQS